MMLLVGLGMAGSVAGVGMPVVENDYRSLPLTTVSGLPTKLISVEFQDADIHAVMRFMAEAGDVNIVLSDDVQGKITVRLKDVPWDEALSAILATKGLVATTTAGTLLIRPL